MDGRNREHLERRSEKYDVQKNMYESQYERRKTYAGTERSGKVSSLPTPRGTWRDGIDR
jgi:hypothetical protein